MAVGLPDWQIPINISAQDLALLKMDISAQTLAALAVDITTQTLATLGVNIKAQDLAAVAITIAAQTLAALTIKIGAAQTVSIDTFRDWNSEQGNGIHLSGVGAGGGVPIVTYTVTAGKTLYVTEWGASGSLANSAQLQVTGVAVQAYDFGVGSPAIDHLSTPLKVAGGLVIRIICPAVGTNHGNIVGVEI